MKSPREEPRPCSTPPHARPAETARHRRRSCSPVAGVPGVGCTGSLPGAAGAAMSWFSRMRGNSHAQLETPEDEKYPEGKGGVLKAKTADFVLNKGEKLGIHLTDNNIITKIDAGSIAERDANFKVGDTIVAVNGESADGLEVAEMIKDMDAVSLTVTRKRNSVRVSVRRRYMLPTPPSTSGAAAEASCSVPRMLAESRVAEGPLRVVARTHQGRRRRGRGGTTSDVEAPSPSRRPRSCGPNLARGCDRSWCVCVCVW